MASSKYIKGITISIGADTQKLTKALEGVNKQSRDLQGELRQVERLLKLDPGNTELLEQKQKLLAKSIENTKEKLGTLKEAEKQVQQQFEKGEIGEEQYRAIQREVIKAEQELQKFEKRLQSSGNESKSFKDRLEEVGKSAKDIGGKLKSVGTTMSAAVTAPIVGGFAALTAGTKEFRSDLARLEANAEVAGQKMDVLNDAMTKLHAVTGETDSSVEGLSNLLATGFRDEQLTELLDSLYGASIKFSDTLKFEGIADGLQETLATGEAVGPFAELLERSGIVLDNFNAGLQEAIANGEQENYILQTLAQTGLSETYEAWRKNNEEMVKSEEANYRMQQAFAELGATLEPILTPIIEGVTNLVNKFNEMSPTSQQVILAIAGIAAAIGPLLVAFGAVASAISALIPLFGAISVAIGAISAPVAIAVAAVAGLIAAGVALYKNWEEVKIFLDKTWEEIKNIFETTVSAISSFLSNSWQEISNVTADMWNAIETFFMNIWSEIKNVFETAVNSIASFLNKSWQVIKIVITTVWYAIKIFFFNIWNNIKNVFETAVNSIVSFLETSWQVISSTITAVWNNIKAFFYNIWEEIKNIFETTVSAISSFLSNSWESIYATTQTVWKNVKNAIVSPIETARDTLFNIIDKIKNAFANLKIEIPKPKLPHIDVSWRTVGFGPAKVTIPTFDIDWYKMGGIFDQAAVIGVGEAGREAVVPLENERYMAPFADAVYKRLVKNLEGEGLVGGIQNNITINSSQPLSPSEIARQVKKAQQELALGF